MRDAIDRHALLVFPDQSLDGPPAQLAFTRQLGEPEVEHVKYGREGVVDYFGTVGNVDENGRQRGSAHEMTRYARGKRDVALGFLVPQGPPSLVTVHLCP